MEGKLPGGPGQTDDNGGERAPLAEDVALSDPSMSPPSAIPLATPGRLTDDAAGGSRYKLGAPSDSTSPTENVFKRKQTRGFLDAPPAGPTARAFQPCDEPFPSVDSSLLELTTAFEVSLENALDGKEAKLAARLKALAGAIKARHIADVLDLQSKSAVVTKSLKTQREKVLATEKALTKARAQATILSEELRVRGGTKHYSNLTVKLNIAEAEIRSVNARKMQLAVKLAHAEREKEQALQGQALAEATLHERGGTTLTSTKNGRTRQRQTFRDHPVNRRGLPERVRQPRKETIAELDRLESAGASWGTSENNEDFSECISSHGSQTSPGGSPRHSASKPPAEVKPDEGKSTTARNGIRAAQEIEPSGGDSDGVGVARRREKSGVELEAAVERSRASERRCVALLAASSKDLEAERRESQRLRDALHLFEREQNAAGSDNAEAEKRAQAATAIVQEQRHDGEEKKAKGGSEDGGLNFLLEMRRGFGVSAMLSNMSEAMCQFGLGEPDSADSTVKDEVFSVRVALASTWVLLLAAAVVIVALIHVARRDTTSWCALLCE